ncbi:MAG: AAA family ATPase [Chromatiales bacterium]|nr:AAA family ATPase [Chromatiales bacterium]
MILLVGNLKGGTGKSTISFNLAVWSAYQLRRTLLIDTDPLHTIASLLHVRKEEGHQPVIYSLVAEEAHVQEEVDRVADLFDDVIVDIAAGDIAGFRAALKAADKVLIPLLPGQADVWALDDVMPLIDEARQRKPDLPVMAVINKADTNASVRETQETEEALSQVEGLSLAPVRIGYRVLMRRSLTEGLGVAEWAPRSSAAKEIDTLARAVFEIGEK